MTAHPDHLRTPENLFSPDPRSTDSAVLGYSGFRTKTLQDHYDAVAPITLHDGVPAAIVLNFDNARNVYLLSWLAYRLHSAARTQAYECLEFALRLRFKDELYVLEQEKRRARYEQDLKECPCKVKGPYKSITKEKFRPTLHPLLEYAIKVGAVKNENFSAWQQRTELRARHRRDVETIMNMRRLGVTQIEFDDTQLEINDEDRHHDYLRQVLRSIPFLRNHYAHGTSSLDNKSLSALSLTAEIINQIYPRRSG